MRADADILHRHRSLLTPLAVAGAGAVGLLDCIVQQLLASGVAQPDLASRWAVSTLMPWLFVLYFIRRRLERQASWSPTAEAALLAAMLFLSVTLDILLFDLEAWRAADILGRAQARLPILIAVPVLARLALQTDDCSPETSDTSLSAGLAAELRNCRLCIAAGNYVEVDDGRRIRLMRMTMRQAEEALGNDYVRIHRSTIVARALIVSLDRDRHGVCGVRLSDGCRLRVGRAYRTRLRASTCHSSQIPPARPAALDR